MILDYGATAWYWAKDQRGRSACEELPIQTNAGNILQEDEAARLHQSITTMAGAA